LRRNHRRAPIATKRLDELGVGRNVSVLLGRGEKICRNATGETGVLGGSDETSRFGLVEHHLVAPLRLFGLRLLYFLGRVTHDGLLC